MTGPRLHLCLCTALTVTAVTASFSAAQHDTILVPAGPFYMGQDGFHPEAYLDEYEPHIADVPTLSIGRNEITNAQYAAFLSAAGTTEDEEGHPYIGLDDPDLRIHFDGFEWLPDADWENHPMREVSWFGADAYCRWYGGRLPTEAEWEKAARWDPDLQVAFVWPWGNVFDCTLNSSWWCNEPYDTGITTYPVGSFPDGASPYGARDMAGNVWEWTMGGYTSYPLCEFEFEDYTREVQRGGSWTNSDYNLRCAARSPQPRYITDANLGFRICYSDTEPTVPVTEVPPRDTYAYWTETFLADTPLDDTLFWWGTGYAFYVDTDENLFVAELKSEPGASRVVGEVMSMIRRDTGSRFAPDDIVDISVRLKYERGDRDYARTSVAFAWGDDREIIPGGRGADENTGYPWFLLANNSDTPELWHIVTAKHVPWGEGKFCIGFGLWGNLSHKADPPIMYQHRMFVDWVRVRHSGDHWNPGDYDHDGDVDQDDCDLFRSCQTGPGIQGPKPGCEDKDLDHDNDVDQSDFGIFQRCLSGPNIPSDPNCAD